MYICGEYGKQIHNLGLPGCIILDCMSLNGYPVCSSAVVDLTAKVEILKSRVIYTCSYRQHRAPKILKSRYLNSQFSPMHRSAPH